MQGRFSKLTVEQRRQRDIDRATTWNKTHPEARKRISAKHHTAHRDKELKAGKKYRQTPKGRERAKHQRLKAFNLTVEQYDWMLTSQGGVCAICKRPELYTTKNGHTARLAVDHDHSCCSSSSSCGECIRALLCRSCNAALGLLAENPDRIRQMAYYVESFKPSKDIHND